MRWALIEGISRYHGGPHLAVEFHRLAERRGKNKARVAIARRVLTLAYYGLRDGEIRCLTQPARRHESSDTTTDGELDDRHDPRRIACGVDLTD